MKKIYAVLVLTTLVGTATVFSAGEQTKEFKGSGEVLSTNAVYEQITIKHGSIKGFAAGGETDFFVTSKDLLKDIQTRDLVDFVIREEKGDARIEKITKTGQAPPKDETLPLGKAVQGVLVATGEAAKTVTSPLPPAHEVVSGTVGATTNASAAALEDVGPETKKKF